MKITEADRYFSLAVRTRDGWACRFCNAHYEPTSKENKQRLQCAHIYGRGIKATRYSADNAVALCAGCHKWFTERPTEFHVWLLKELGAGHMELLAEKTNATGKDCKLTRAEVSKHYRLELKRMESLGVRDLVSWN